MGDGPVDAVILAIHGDQIAHLLLKARAAGKLARPFGVDQRHQRLEWLIDKLLWIVLDGDNVGISGHQPKRRETGDVDEGQRIVPAQAREQIVKRALDLGKHTSVSTMASGPKGCVGHGCLRAFLRQTKLSMKLA